VVAIEVQASSSIPSIMEKCLLDPAHIDRVGLV
jgi:hypothetical protein